MADVPLRREEVQRRTRRKKIFSDGKRFLGRQGSGGERQKRRMAGGCDGIVFLGSPSCPRFPQAPASRGPSETGLRPSELQDFLPIAGWAAKWCGDVEG